MNVERLLQQYLIVCAVIMDEGIEEAILYSYNALVPFAILTSLVAVPLGVVYLVYPQSILQLYLRYVRLV